MAETIKIYILKWLNWFVQRRINKTTIWQLLWSNMHNTWSIKRVEITTMESTELNITLCEASDGMATSHYVMHQMVWQHHIMWSIRWYSNITLCEASDGMATSHYVKHQMVWQHHIMWSIRWYGNITLCEASDVMANSNFNLHPYHLKDIQKCIRQQRHQFRAWNIYDDCRFKGRLTVYRGPLGTRRLRRLLDLHLKEDLEAILARHRKWSLGYHGHGRERERRLAYTKIRSFNWTLLIANKL